MPFKLTSEFVEVLGGDDSKGFMRFRKHFIAGFYAIHKNADKLILLVQMLANTQSDLPCFQFGGVPLALK